MDLLFIFLFGASGGFTLQPVWMSLGSFSGGFGEGFSGLKGHRKTLRSGEALSERCECREPQRYPLMVKDDLCLAYLFCIWAMTCEGDLSEKQVKGMVKTSKRCLFLTFPGPHLVGIPCLLLDFMFCCAWKSH